LSSPKSALTAVEQARKLLFGVTKKQGAQESGPVDRAAERVHEMLNNIEIALSDCVTFIEDDEGGLVRALETERSSCPVSLDQIDSLIGDWGALSRKHGVSSYELPSCHSHLKQERDGSASLREHLQSAISEEKEKLKLFSLASKQLTMERMKVGHQLEKDVTDRLPSLSMENCAFRIVLEQSKTFTDLSVVSGATYVDDAFFLLENSGEEGGRVHEVASSGEKARLLLAIESSLPGSIGALSRVNSGEASLEFASVLPVVVVYDEIDAHVGGSAANTLASLLAIQSQRSQILAITHSPPVGAVADMHMVVKKRYGSKNEISGANPLIMIDVRAIEGNERRLELARMASGDMAAREAEEFAAALIREGALRREANG
jgi:DNA repair protein RecN (Recombination protein N)